MAYSGRFGVGLLALPLVGCGSAHQPVSNVPLDTLRVAYPALQPTLDPHDWTTANGPRTLAPLFDALTFVQSDGQLRPALAVAWQRLNPATWQFQLRVDDAKFHNGEMFSPDSVKLTFDRLMAPGSTLPLSRALSTVARLDVVNAWTINITTKQPDDMLARRLSVVYMLPPQYFAQVGEDGFRQRPIGTGFWMFDSFDPEKSLNVVQFRDTWRAARGDDPPPLKRLEVQVLAQAQDRARALQSLSLDVATALDDGLASGLQQTGFRVQRSNLGQANQTDAPWQHDAFGAPLSQGTDISATVYNLQGLVAEPNGAWWFDRVTKSEMQRIAVMGGA